MTKTKICHCGEEKPLNSPNCLKKCEYFKEEYNRVFVLGKEELINFYNEEISISGCQRKFLTSNGTEFSRGYFVALFKQEGIFEDVKSAKRGMKHYERTKKGTKEKYGVENYGSLKISGWTKLNKVEYRKIGYFDEDYKEYRNQAYKIMQKNLRNQEVPDYCELTGIKFADTEGPTNPNDPRKRSVDHKIPLIHCYLNNVPVEKASERENLMYVLKLVNSIKSQTLYESFLPLVPKIRKALINEGFESI